MTATPSIGWFARHELRLAWRDTVALLRGGRRRRGVGMALGVIFFVLALHVIAYAMLAPSAPELRHPDKALLVSLSGSAALTWALLVSQAMETVTRSFYARADLDLILSSPADARRLFAIRIAANAVTTVATAWALFAPLVDTAALLGGPRYLSAYGVIAAMGISAVALAVAAAALMFRIVGPKHTRLIAQIAAAVVGAGFVIWVQVAAIMSYGSLSRTLMFRSPEWIAAAPVPSSLIWLPARAAMGHGGALAALLAGALVLLATAIALTAQSFARQSTTIAGVAVETKVAPRRAGAFRRRSPASVLRSKEWVLLRRDPWLVSQSLMQILYLVPPALLLWRDLGHTNDSLLVLVPVLVMAAGQLAGGLAWLAISGEDAPDLVATAPISGIAILRAKVEAVIATVAVPILPIAIAMIWASPWIALMTLVGAALSAAGAAAVQFFFRSQAKRSNFRRRQTSSRIATLAEAFLSISIAAAAGFAAAGHRVIGLIFLAVAVGILFASRLAAGPQGAIVPVGASAR